MNESQLSDLLARVRQRERDEPVATQTVTPECLSFSRARALTLEPDRLTAAEQRHIESCLHCASLMATFARCMTHPPIGTLLRWVQRRLADQEREVMAYHLEEGGCQRCRDRCRQLETIWNQIVAFPVPLPLRHPTMAMANTREPLEVKAVSGDARLEAEIWEEDERLVLEVRTKDPAFRSTLIGCVIEGSEGSEAQTVPLLLEPDVNDWYAGHLSLDRGSLFDRCGGEISRLQILPMTASPSLEAEYALLIEAVRSAMNLEPGMGWEEWREKWEQQGPLSAEARQLLDGLRDVSQG